MTRGSSLWAHVAALAVLQGCGSAADAGRPDAGAGNVVAEVGLTPAVVPTDEGVLALYTVSVNASPRPRIELRSARSPDGMAWSPGARVAESIAGEWSRRNFAASVEGNAVAVAYGRPDADDRFSFPEVALTRDGGQSFTNLDVPASALQGCVAVRQGIVYVAFVANGLHVARYNVADGALMDVGELTQSFFSGSCHQLVRTNSGLVLLVGETFLVQAWSSRDGSMWTRGGSMGDVDELRAVVSAGDHVAADIVVDQNAAIARSGDLGASWEVSSSLPSIAWASDGTRMWGVFYTTSRAQLHRSDDGGKVWQRVGDMPFIQEGQPALAASLDRLVAIYSAGNVLRAAVSTDGGMTWTR